MTEKIKAAAMTLAACAATLCAFSAFGGERVWDATKNGQLMTATTDIVLFKGATLAESRLARCWFNKARRRAVSRVVYSRAISGTRKRHLACALKKHPVSRSHNRCGRGVPVPVLDCACRRVA